MARRGLLLSDEAQNPTGFDEDDRRLEKLASLLREAWECARGHTNIFHLMNCQRTLNLQFVVQIF